MRTGETFDTGGLSYVTKSAGRLYFSIGGELCKAGVESVTGVAMVTGHVERVVVVLRVDGHAVVFSPQPLTT